MNQDDDVSTMDEDEIVGIQIPPKRVTLNKIQLKAKFVQFELKNQRPNNEYDPEITIHSTDDVARILLKKIAPYGSDPDEAAELALIGHSNSYEKLSKKERNRLEGIANEVARSRDFLLCQCECVEGVIEEPDFEECTDPTIIAFYSLVFHETSWILVSMSEYADCIQFGYESRNFCLVRDINSPDFQRFNNELTKIEGEGTFTLSTPVKEYDVSPRDILPWRHYHCTPWPIDEEDGDVPEDAWWTQSSPRIKNYSQTYRVLLDRMDEMNDYKNRLRSEVRRLTLALEGANKRIDQANKRIDQLEKQSELVQSPFRRGD